MPDERVQQMLSDLRRALCDAISDSREVHRTWQQLREEGYSLYLLVDCKQQADEEADEELRPAVRPGRPQFRINGEDLSFLRSIGIDPTRRPRRRS